MSECAFHAQLEPYYDGELEAGAHAAFERHLGGCDACTRQLDRLVATSRILTEEFRPELSPFSLRRLHKRVDAIMEQGVLRLAWAMSGLAAAVLVAGSVWLATARDAPEAPPPWVDVAMSPALDAAQQGDAPAPVAQWYLADASAPAGGTNEEAP